MKRTALFTSIIAATCVMLAPLATAGVPQLMNYQGRLTDAGGAPSDTTVSMVYDIYADSTGGTALWTESHPTVNVDSGTFSVILGTVTPIDDSVFVGDHRWLEITVGGETITPRTRLTSSPFAMRVSTVDSASGGVIIGTLGVLGDGSKQFADPNRHATEPPDFWSPFVGAGWPAGYDPPHPPQAGHIHVYDAAGVKVMDFDGQAGKAFIGYNCTNDGLRAFSVGIDNFTFSNYGTIGGGRDNIAGIAGSPASAEFATISGGRQHRAEAHFATIGGGRGNEALGEAATIGGGRWNMVETTSGTVGGGDTNYVYGGAEWGTIGGGMSNMVSDTGGTIAGGSSNYANASFAFIGGGEKCMAQGRHSAIGGGLLNEIDISGRYGTIGSGDSNYVEGNYATIPGGLENTASGDRSFAAGWKARALHHGTFVWADNQGTDFSSTGINQFLIRADSGVGIRTYNPRAQLHIGGNNTALSAFPVYTAPTSTNGIGTPVDEAALQGLLFDAYTIGMNKRYGDIVSLGYANVGTPAGGSVIRFLTNDHLTGSGIAVERMRIERNGNVGIGTASPTERLHVVGNICATGTVGGTSFVGACSDERFKTNIETMSGALDKVTKLRGVNFDWRRDEFPEHEFAEGRQVGFVAQEIKEVLSQVVWKGGDGYYMVDYGRLTPVLVEAIKEQQMTIDELKTQLHELQESKRAEIESLKAQMAQMQALVETILAQQSESTAGSAELAISK